MKTKPNVLVVLGLAVFLVGSGFALLSMRHHTSTSQSSAAGAGGEVVVAARDIPAGTSGAAMVEQQMVRLTGAPAHHYPDSVVSVTALDNQVVSVPVKAGDTLRVGELAAASTMPLPTGDQALTVTIGSGAAAVAGYLKPGDTVDVYATVSKLSAPSVLNAGVPCTELVAANVPVLDVSTVVPGYAQQPTPTGRATPPNVTVLLAATSDQAPQLVFMTTNESLYLAKVPAGQPAPPLYQCVGTGQLVGAAPHGA